ncbi:cytochrome P450 [Rhypophila decipiens]|uniref:Cytochrome P450 n=1 Tax=Rhypophila decipiens TaxID=261697 RepID=A0AAN6Y4D8_9PEZI|nr:cytochrome P450 [Rhypophila decipiens]
MAISYLMSAALAAVAYFLISTFRSWYRLRHIPGPFLASISYLWIAKTVVSGTSHRILKHIQAKYNSPLVRIGPNDLVTSSATIIRHINAARSVYTRDEMYAALGADPDNPNMFSTLDEALHSQLKSKTAAGYAGKAVPTFEADIDGQLTAFKGLIREKYLSTSKSFKPMDMSRAIPWFTMDSITKLSFGEEWGHIKADDDIRGFVDASTKFARFGTLCAETPPLRRIMFSKPMLRLMGPKETDAAGLGYVSGQAKKVVSERFDLENPAEKQDMLGSFIRHGITRKQCETEISLTLLAGSETTGGTLRCALFHILTTPHVYKKLQAEIDEAVAQGKASAPVISYAEAQRLPYLQAVIYEGIRVQPSVKLLSTKVVGPEGDTLEGHFVPPGTRISVNIWGLMRNREVFGDDVETFRPERFMEAGGEKERGRMEKDVELIFGHGRYMCAGKVIAFMELSKFFFELLRDFDLQITNSCEPWDVEYYVTAIIRNLWVRITKRSH